jgi:hypothetical protein
MFLGSVSGGLIALGLVATATRVGTAFYAFGLVLLPLLAFVGVMSFERTLQNGIEDWGYARRIARLRAYYFDQAPELLPYMLSVPPTERLPVLGLPRSRWQGWRSVAGMVAVITAALAGGRRAARRGGIRSLACSRAARRRGRRDRDRLDADAPPKRGMDPSERGASQHRHRDTEREWRLDGADRAHLLGARPRGLHPQDGPAAATPERGWTPSSRALMGHKWA